MIGNRSSQHIPSVGLPASRVSGVVELYADRGGWAVNRCHGYL